jgi:hypothetical protein
MGIGMVAEIASSIACGKTGAVLKEEPSNLVATCAIFLAAECAICLTCGTDELKNGVRLNYIIYHKILYVPRYIG